jgi:hypothetical protein
MPNPPSADTQSAVAEMRSLLAAYPQLNDNACDRLVGLMHKAPRLEVGLLSSDPALGEKYRAFRAREARRFRPSLWATAKFLAASLVPAAVVIWAIVEKA